jgi:hypothetical protein
VKANTAVSSRRCWRTRDSETLRRQIVISVIQRGIDIYAARRADAEQ